MILAASGQSSLGIYLLHRREKPIDRHRRESRKAVGDRVRQHERAVVHHRTAGICDIGHIAVALFGARLDQRAGHACQQFGRVVAIEQADAEAIVTHGAHAVCDNQPSFFDLDRRAAVADLDKFPWPARFDNDLLPFCQS